MSKAFLTGSLVYGTPHRDSDVDFVILVDRDTLEHLNRESDRPVNARASYPTESASIRFGRLNLILTTRQEVFDAWHKGTSLLKSKGHPVTREHAVEVIKACLLLADQEPHVELCPVPSQRRLPAPG